MSFLGRAACVGALLGILAAIVAPSDWFDGLKAWVDPLVNGQADDIGTPDDGGQSAALESGISGQPMSVPPMMFRVDNDGRIEVFPQSSDGVAQPNAAVPRPAP